MRELPSARCSSTGANSASSDVGILREIVEAVCDLRSRRGDQLPEHVIRQVWSACGSRSMIVVEVGSRTIDADPPSRRRVSTRSTDEPAATSSLHRAGHDQLQVGGLDLVMLGGAGDPALSGRADEHLAGTHLGEHVVDQRSARPAPGRLVNDPRCTDPMARNGRLRASSDRRDDRDGIGCANRLGTYGWKRSSLPRASSRIEMRK